MNKVLMRFMLLLGVMLLMMGCTKPRAEVDQEPESISQIAAETKETQEHTTAIETEPEETQDQATAIETEPEETQDQATATETEPEETLYTGPAAGSLDYLEYLAMTVEEQEAYYNQFASFDEFITWYNQAEEDYLASVGTSETNETRFEEGVEDWE